MASTIRQSIRKLKPPGYILACFLVSIGGFLNGYDTGSIGGVVDMSQFTGTFGDLGTSTKAWTVSLIMLAGAVPAILAGQLADRFGHLRVTLVGALTFALGAILEGAAGKLPMFLAGRVLCGLGEGLWLSNVSVYITEISPSARRGMLVAMPQMLCTVGICTGYFTCYGSVNLPSSMAWRLPYVIQAILGLILAGTCLVLPQSPRWLIHHGKRDEAIRAIEKLDFSRTEAEKDFLGPAATQRGPSLGFIDGFFLMFKRGYRARTILALFTLGMVQLSGIDGVLYYAPLLFRQAGMPGQQASFLASGVSAILMLAISIPAVAFADRWGRRTSLLSGGVILSSCMFLIGALYAANSVHPYGVTRWVVVVTIFVFALTFSVTWAVSGKIYASEIQPTNTRNTANALAQGLGFLTNWIVAITTPIFLSKSAYGAYFLFGGLTLGTALVLAAYMPETRGRSLESIQEAFNRPVMKSVTHHIRRMFSSTNASSGSGSSGRESLELNEIRNVEGVGSTALDSSLGPMRVAAATM